MLEDRIIVQDRGIDAGLAALMQNANKGMDPTALMAMMNNGGFGGNGGWWWIWIILIFFCWGGFGNNGFGRGSNDASHLASQLNVMKKWLSAKYYQISWEQIMNQLERTIKYQNYRKKSVS